MALVIASAAAPSTTHAADNEPHCADDAREHAVKLLALHVDDSGLRSGIDKSVTRAPSIHNPAYPKQKLDVLAIDGWVYKSRYRMRFIYAPMPDDECVLVGQEILEFAKF